MKVEIEWRKDLPNIAFFDCYVLVTLYNEISSEFMVDFAYINNLGRFEKVEDFEPFIFPVIAWSELPSPCCGPAPF